MLSIRVDVEDINVDFFNLRIKILFDEEGIYVYLLDWIDYYEVFLFFKQEKFYEGKDKIKEIVSKKDLEVDL